MYINKKLLIHGSAYAIFPDMPIMETLDDEGIKLKTYIIVNTVVASLIRIDVFTPKHFYAALCFAVFLIISFLFLLLTLIFQI